MAPYARPADLDGALDELSRGPRAVLAGGTDFYPARVGRPLDEPVLDISAIGALKRIETDDSGIRLGALVTWSDLLRAPLPPAFDGYKLAAREVGGVQVQNAGTLAGNLCNASPAADGTPNLLALDARVELRSRARRRELPVAEFVQGARRTGLQSGEMVTAIIVPAPAPGTRGHFTKLGARRYLVISIVMVAVVLEPDMRGAVSRARVSVGSCSAVARRLAALERALAGQPIGAGLGALAEPAHMSPLEPIDDVRGTAAYRRDAALTLVRRALDETALEFGALLRAAPSDAER